MPPFPNPFSWHPPLYESSHLFPRKNERFSRTAAAQCAQVISPTLLSGRIVKFVFLFRAELRFPESTQRGSPPCAPGQASVLRVEDRTSSFFLHTLGLSVSCLSVWDWIAGRVGPASPMGPVLFSRQHMLLRAKLDEVGRFFDDVSSSHSLFLF